MFNLKLHNFRGFKNQQLNFSRINILIGENSGGKSSLLKFLLSLKQTLISSQEVNLKLKGDLTDLGNYKEVIYNKKKNSKIKFKFSNKEEYFHYFLEMIQAFEGPFDKKNLILIRKNIKSYITNETTVEFTLTNKLDKHKSIKTKFSNKSIGTLEIIQKGENFFGEINCDLKFKFNKAQGIIKDSSATKEGFFTLLNLGLRNIIKKQFKKDFNYVYYSIAYLLIFQNYINDKIGKIRFANPINSSPKRFYFQEDKKGSYNMSDINKFINIMGDEALSENEYNKRMNLLNKTIKEFGIAEEIEIVRNKNLPIIALNVKTKDFWSNIKDVGYGVSLQIPILFQAIFSENYTVDGQIILIEQPEVHLHPKLQAKFIETLLSIGNKNVYFIETHSEHIVRKLQAIVKNNTYDIKPEDVSIHYFKRSISKFDVSSHKILQTGKLTPVFPDSFYDVSYSLVKELL